MPSGRGKYLKWNVEVWWRPAGPGTLHPPPQAQVPDLIALGGTPNVLALPLKHDLGHPLGLAVQLAAEGHCRIGRYRHRHAVVADEIAVAGANVKRGAPERAHAVRLPDLADPGRPHRLRRRLQGRGGEGR